MNREGSSRWKPGVSGNPQGRKPGSGAVQALRTQIELLVPEIIQKMAQKALDGDVGAARLLLERAIPPLKPAEALQTLHIEGGDLTSQAKSIIGLAASGEVSATNAGQLLVALSNLAKLIESDALEQRIQALEKSLEAGQP